ncbi:MAG: aldo/keto reductase [Spirochaetota bacterium]
MEKRTYGKHADTLSVVGFGGILVMNETAEESARRVSLAIDRGVNYFDVAPTYGNAEDMLGPALEPYRKDVFLACKTNIRTAEAAETEFNESLAKLRTDHFDLYQLHGVQTQEEVDVLLSDEGTLEFVQRMQREGRVRYIGFSAHNEDAAIRLLDAFPFDSVLFPINWGTWYGGEFGPRLVEAAQKREAAILALKALAWRRWEEDEERHWNKTWYRPVDTAEQAERFLRFTLSRPVTSAVSPGHIEHFQWACDAADRFTPLSDDEEAALEAEARTLKAPVFSKTVTSI